MADMADLTDSTRRIRTVVKRSRVRRAGESAYGLLLLTKQLVLVGVVLLVLAAGVWASWDAAGFAAARDGRGTMTVARCTQEACTGSFAPLAASEQPRERVVLKDTAGTEKGAKVPVALRGGGDEVVRTGTAGIFRACLPFGGALILAAVVIAGGLRMRRTAWAAGAAGFGVLIGAFVTM